MLPSGVRFLLSPPACRRPIYHSNICYTTCFPMLFNSYLSGIFPLFYFLLTSTLVPLLDPESSLCFIAYSRHAHLRVVGLSASFFFLYSLIRTPNYFYLSISRSIQFHTQDYRINTQGKNGKNVTSFISFAVD